jgi:hypothetical protein
MEYHREHFSITVYRLCQKMRPNAGFGEKADAIHYLDGMILLRGRHPRSPDHRARFPRQLSEGYTRRKPRFHSEQRTRLPSRVPSFSSIQFQDTH